jgi:ankyrin repeat protein
MMQQTTGMLTLCACLSVCLKFVYAKAWLSLFFIAASGADVNAMDKYGNTPLHRAAGSGYTAIVQALFDLGADLTLPTNVRIMLMCS